MKDFYIVAATGCPTGVAHTFMAAQGLEDAARELGVKIKVETHGQIGVENELTEEEIARADAVIIAADKDVHDERFIGKPVIEVPVAQGIKNPQALIERALEGGGVVKVGAKKQEGGNSQTQSTDHLSLGRKIYRHLMNGVSHMLPFVVSGGVLIALSFLFGIYSADPDSSQYNVFAAQLNTVGGFAMGMMTPILAAFIAESIGKRPGMVAGFVGGLIANDGGAGFLGGILAGFLAGYTIIVLQKLLAFIPSTLDGLKAIFLYPVLSVLITGLVMSYVVTPMAAVNEWMMTFLASFEDSNAVLLGIIVGCMCAFDFGGPVNKAAYVTGTFLLSQGNTTFMAGVSAACIAPPLITTVAAVLFKSEFTRDERNAAYVNFILGCTHITEGAIPFVAKDPLKGIPTMMLGSSVAAVLTYLFKVQVSAPHGGFLILPTVVHPLLWILAIAAGSLVGGVALGLTRRMTHKKAVT